MDDDALAQADAYDEIEEDLNRALAVSLSPRSTSVLYDVVAEHVASGGLAVDVGCGEGNQAIEIAQRCGARVVALDPLTRRMAVEPAVAVAADVMFMAATAEAIPLADAVADVVLCREMLYVVDDVEVVLAECRRVLAPTGHVVVYQLFNTAWLEPEEAIRFWGSADAARRNDPAQFEAALTRAGLAVAELIELGSETVEWAEEDNGKGGRELLASVRLLRDPSRYIAEFGRSAYDIKLNDAFWFIYRMIGKLTQRIYVACPG